MGGVSKSVVVFRSSRTKVQRCVKFEGRYTWLSIDPSYAHELAHYRKERNIATILTPTGKNQLLRGRLRRSVRVLRTWKQVLQRGIIMRTVIWLELQAQVSSTAAIVSAIATAINKYPKSDSRSRMRVILSLHVPQKACAPLFLRAKLDKNQAADADTSK